MVRLPVAETFEHEAAETKAQLAAYTPFDTVFSSPLTRARKLATFCGYAHPEVDDRLKEMYMGDWEMQRYDEIEDGSLQQWYNDYMHLAATNGESFPILYAFLDELKSRPYHRSAIFAHGGVLICAGIYGGLFSSDHAFEHLTPYGGIEVIRI